MNRILYARSLQSSGKKTHIPSPSAPSRVDWIHSVAMGSSGNSCKLLSIYFHAHIANVPSNLRATLQSSFNYPLLQNWGLMETNARLKVLQVAQEEERLTSKTGSALPSPEEGQIKSGDIGHDCLKSKYSWFTMFQVYSKVIQLCIYIYIYICIYSFSDFFSL